LLPIAKQGVALLRPDLEAAEMEPHGALRGLPDEGVHRQLSGSDGQVAAVTRFTGRRAAEDSCGSFERETTILELASDRQADRSEVHG
jgi:hypothetical protein